ncbi:carbamoyl-phosphate synthase-like protein arginine-specific small chain [Limtongia smithiae]|uniref:carbamoyl-phosphate synthase-like protein arginine-specific small chain n=1 Tax=Limtongia smithiae TaxID=1125753 RepID=UPI0034CD5737
MFFRLSTTELLTRALKSATSSSRLLATATASSQQRLYSNVLPKAKLIVKDGPSYSGFSFGAEHGVSGEAVFTTSLVGYPESMTDPSYTGQILVFTQPLIGNYGVPDSNMLDEYGIHRYLESPRIQCAGIVVSDYASEYSHWTAVESISEWCTRQGVPAITGVDTRAIVSYLRDQGSSLAKIAVAGHDNGSQTFTDPGKKHLVAEVATKMPYTVNPGQDIQIVVVDCGVKSNIIRCLVSRGATALVVPHNFPIQDIANSVDGIFISNGPGDPTHCSETIFNLQQTMAKSNVPIFGICLGHQLLALAVGAQTVKLKYGNRAHNIPTLDLTTGRCHITSQNHGYAVDADTLPAEFKEYFINLNDRSNEGMYHVDRPIFSTQFHPEAKGGPMDSAFLFDKFLENIREYKAEGAGQAGGAKPTLSVSLGAEAATATASAAGAA